MVVVCGVCGGLIVKSVTMLLSVCVCCMYIISIILKPCDYSILEKGRRADGAR